MRFAGQLMPVVRRRFIGLRRWPDAICSMGIGFEMSLTFSTLRDHVLTLISPSTATSMAALIKLTKGSAPVATHWM